MTLDFRKRLCATAARFVVSSDGGAGMLFALSFVPAVLVAGSAVDLGRAVREKGELAAATDGAALSAGKLMKTKTPAQLAEVATSFLAASNPNFALVGTPTVTADKSEVCIATTSSVPTTLMQIANISSIGIGARTCVKTGGTTYEIALSLDVTGSMNDGDKIGSLKTAARNFIDTVLPSNGSQNGYVNISIVPFSTSVRAFDPAAIAESGNDNEATRFANVAFMDNGGNSSIHWENYPKVSGGSFNPANRFEMFANMNQRWGGCFEARPGAYALTDAAPNPATADSLFVPLLAPDEGDDASNAYNNYLSDSGNSICRNGDPYFVRDRQSPYFRDGQSMLCKYKPAVRTETVTIPGACRTSQEEYTYTERERQRVCTTDRRGRTDCDWEWVSVTRTGTRDVRTCEPDTTETRTTPLTLNVNTGNGRGPNRSCQTQTVMQLSNSSASLKAKIDSLSAGGNTNIIEGLMWGWRSISPNGPYTGAQSYTKPNHKKVLVLMTDGENTWSSDSDNANVSDYSPFGFFWNNRLGSAGGAIGNVSRNNVRNYMDAKTLEACNNAKAAGVEIHAVAFSHSRYPIDDQGKALLQACASDSAKYHLVTNGSELNLAFQNIGGSLDGLHISR